MNRFVKPLLFASAVCALPAAAVAPSSPRLSIKVLPAGHVPYASVSHLPSSKPAVLDNGKVLRYTGGKISIVVYSGPPSDMLSFRIDGRKNPLVELPAHSKVTFTFVNVDDDMMHNFRITGAKVNLKKPIDAKLGWGTEMLNPHTKTEASIQKLVFSTPSKHESLTYLCTVMGHAAGGMIGRMQVYSK